METKLFSYRVAGVVLEPVNDKVKLSKSFDRKLLISELKEALADENFKIDERSLDYKIVDGQLFIEGIMVENETPKSIGFMSGK